MAFILLHSIIVVNLFLLCGLQWQHKLFTDSVSKPPNLFLSTVLFHLFFSITSVRQLLKTVHVCPPLCLKPRLSTGRHPVNGAASFSHAVWVISQGNSHIHLHTLRNQVSLASPTCWDPILIGPCRPSYRDVQCPALRLKSIGMKEGDWIHHYHIFILEKNVLEFFLLCHHPVRHWHEDGKEVMPCQCNNLSVGFIEEAGFQIFRAKATLPTEMRGLHRSSQRPAGIWEPSITFRYWCQDSLNPASCKQLAK